MSYPELGICIPNLGHFLENNWAPDHMVSHPYDWMFVTGAKLGLHLCLYQKSEHDKREFLSRGIEETLSIVLTSGENKRSDQARQTGIFLKKTIRIPRFLLSQAERTRGASKHDKKDPLSAYQEETLSVVLSCREN